MKDLIADLTVRTEQLDQETKRLVRTIRVSRLERVGIGLLLAVTAVLGLLSYRQAQTNHAQANTNHATAVSSQQLVREIESCTVPTGSCYQRGVKATGNAVITINAFTLIAVECARAGGTDAQIASCVAKKATAARP